MNKNFDDLFQEVSDFDARLTALEEKHSSGFRAVRTTSVTVPNAVATNIKADAVQFDLGSEYNAATGIFTPEKAGTYLVTCAVWYPGKTAGSQIAAGLDVDGAAVDGGDAVSSTTQVRPFSSAILHLNAGANVMCYAFHNTGSSYMTATLAGHDYTSFSAVRLD